MVFIENFVMVREEALYRFFCRLLAMEKRGIVNGRFFQ